MLCIKNNVTNWDGLCVISDRHPGLILAIQTLCQSTRWYLCFCLCHVASNFNQQIGNKKNEGYGNVGRHEESGMKVSNNQG